MNFAICNCCRNSTLLIVAACCAVQGCDRTSPTENPTSSENTTRRIYALGRLEPATGIISISALPGESLKELDPDVKENELAPANGILGLLASYDMRRVQRAALNTKLAIAQEKQEADAELAAAQVHQAQAALAQALAKQKEISLQEQKLRILQRKSQLAAEEYERLQEMRSNDPELVTAHQLRKQKIQLDLAVLDHHIASESYKTTKEAADKAVEAATANLTVARNNQKRLGTKDKPGPLNQTLAIEEEIKIADQALAQSILLAPNVSLDTLQDVTNIQCVRDHHDEKSSPGTPQRPYTVLKVFLRPGEFITRTPIMQLGDLRQMVCVAEVYEADVKEICEEQAVTIRSPAFSGVFADGDLNPQTHVRSGGIQGRVQRIGSLIIPPNLANRNPLAPADRSVVEVRIAIDEADAVQEAAKHVGLQVTVEFGKKPEDCAPTDMAPTKTTDP